MHLRRFHYKERALLFRLCCGLFMLCHGAVYAQFDWKKITMPTAQEVKAGFQKPPSQYSNSVTWGWDGPMSREVIARDLESLHALGFSAATIEAGYRMPVESLSDG